MTKKRLVLNFPALTVNEPITWTLIREYDVQVNILNADISHGKEGKLLVEMKAGEEDMERALSYLNSRKVKISPAVKTIEFDEASCIHCGACTALCFPGALSMDAAARELKFSPELCVACELCIKACPMGLFQVNFGHN